MTDRTPRIGPEEYKAMFAKPEPKRKKDRFGSRAKPTKSSDGRTHASGLECEVYEWLCMLQKNKELVILKLQDCIRLPRGRYKADFKVFENKNNREEWHEAKGLENDTFRRNRVDWARVGPGPLHIWKKEGRRPAKIVKTIIPKTFGHSPQAADWNGA